MTDHFILHFLLPVNGNVPRVVDTVPDIFEPLTVPWKTQSPASSLPPPAIENCTVVPSKVPLPMLPEPRSPEYVPLIWPFSTCRVAEMLTSPDVALTTKLHVPSMPVPADGAAAFFFSSSVGTFVSRPSTKM